MCRTNSLARVVSEGVAWSDLMVENQQTQQLHRRIRASGRRCPMIRPKGQTDSGEISTI